jgi:hypothetical protein
MIIFEGNNTIQYCQKALMKIVEEHLNSNTSRGYKEDSVYIRVTSIRQDDNTFNVVLTTDKEPKND